MKTAASAKLWRPVFDYDSTCGLLEILSDTSCTGVNLTGDFSQRQLLTIAVVTLVLEAGAGRRGVARSSAGNFELGVTDDIVALVDSAKRIRQIHQFAIDRVTNRRQAD